MGLDCRPSGGWGGLVSTLISRNSVLAAALRVAGGGLVSTLISRNSAMTAALRAAGGGLVCTSISRNSVLTATLRELVFCPFFKKFGLD